jgi:hypothetical protein
MQRAGQEAFPFLDNETESYQRNLGKVKGRMTHAMRLTLIPMIDLRAVRDTAWETLQPKIENEIVHKLPETVRIALPPSCDSMTCISTGMAVSK